jgi:hypothetical protein
MPGSGAVEQITPCEWQHIYKKNRHAGYSKCIYIHCERCADVVFPGQTTAVQATIGNVLGQDAS